MQKAEETTTVILDLEDENQTAESDHVVIECPEKVNVETPHLNLEIGCGFHKSRGFTVAIDINRNTSCDLIADSHYLPFKEGSFARVALFEVLEHLRCPLDALREIHRVLGKKGTIVLSVPNVMFYRVFLRWLLQSKITVCPGHISGWTFAELKNLLTKAGFTVVNYVFNDRPWFNKADFLAGILPRVTKQCLVIKGMKS